MVYSHLFLVYGRLVSAYMHYSLRFTYTSLLESNCDSTFDDSITDVYISMFSYLAAYPPSYMGTLYFILPKNIS